MRDLLVFLIPSFAFKQEIKSPCFESSILCPANKKSSQKHGALPTSKFCELSISSASQIVLLFCFDDLRNKRRQIKSLKSRNRDDGGTCKDVFIVR